MTTFSTINDKIEVRSIESPLKNPLKKQICSSHPQKQLRAIDKAPCIDLQHVACVDQFLLAIAYDRRLYKLHGPLLLVHSLICLRQWDAEAEKWSCARRLEIQDLSLLIEEPVSHVTSKIPLMPIALNFLKLDVIV